MNPVIRHGLDRRLSSRPLTSASALSRAEARRGELGPGAGGARRTPPRRAAPSRVRRARATHNYGALFRAVRSPVRPARRRRPRRARGAAFERLCSSVRSISAKGKRPPAAGWKSDER